MIRVNLGNFISSCCLFAMVCGATFLSHRAKCLAGLFVLTPTTRCQQFARRRSVLPVPPRARCNCLSRSALQNFSGRRGIDIFPIFLAPAHSTAVLPSIALGGKRDFVAHFFRLLASFRTTFRRGNQGKSAVGYGIYLEIPGKIAVRCEKKARFVVPRAGRLKVARQFSRGDAATRRKVLPGRAVLHLPPFTFRPPHFAFRPPPSVIPKSLNP